MPYDRTDWSDHAVERPRTYNVVENEDGSVTLIPAFGEVMQQGTNVDATHMDKIEIALKAAYDLAESLGAWRETFDADANVQLAQELMEQVTAAESAIEDALEAIHSTGSAIAYSDGVMTFTTV